MKRTLLFCLLLVSMTALTGACGRKAADENAPGDQAQASAQPQPAGAPAATASEPDSEPKQVAITDELVGKYMEYQKENLALVVKYADETKKNIEAAKGDALKIVKQMEINQRLSKELDEALAAKRAALGLGSAEFEAIKDAAEMMANARMLYMQMGGDEQVAKLAAEQKTQLAALPAEHRAAAEKTMAEMGSTFKNLKDGLDVRKKYGDDATAVLLRHADELARQRLDMLQTIAGKK